MNHVAKCSIVAQYVATDFAFCFVHIILPLLLHTVKILCLHTLATHTVNTIAAYLTTL